MEIKILGVQKAGEKGSNIYAVEPITSDFGKGERFVGRYIKESYSIKPLFIPSNVATYESISVGSKYELFINLSGYVESLKKL